MLAHRADALRRWRENDRRVGDAMVRYRALLSLLQGRILRQVNLVAKPFSVPLFHNLVPEFDDDDDDDQRVKFVFRLV